MVAMRQCLPHTCSFHLALAPQINTESIAHNVQEIRQVAKVRTASDEIRCCAPSGFVSFVFVVGRWGVG